MCYCELFVKRKRIDEEGYIHKTRSKLNQSGLVLFSLAFVSVEIKQTAGKQIDIIDLAGSEKSSHTGAKGMRQLEGSNEMVRKHN